MTFQDLLPLISVLIILLWAGYDRRLNAKQVSGEYLQNIATAAEQIVDLYKQRIDQLEQEVETLKERVLHLEGQVNTFGCLRQDCPMRVWFK